MISESSATSTLNPPETKASVLITVSTPGIETAICRLGNSEEVVRGLTVRELIQRVISPSSLFSVGVPISQLQAESSAALAIGELLGANCCEVVLPGKGDAADHAVSLDQLARAVALEHVGTQGNRFFNINLEVRSAPDAVAPTGHDRRQVPAPPAVEVETPRASIARPLLPAPVAQKPEWQPAPSRQTAEPSEKPVAARPEAPSASVSAREPTSTAPKPVSPAAAGMVSGATAADDSAEAAVGADTASLAQASAGAILTIVAEAPTEEPQERTRERKEYVRKSDWLRAQFLPEVEALDFSGLFVGNLGLGIREEKKRRNVVLADPARITDLLLRANGYRRSGEHAKALICYQELVDMDASNADFRFLLGKTMLALGQKEEAAEALLRAKELGHDGAEKELAELKRSGHRPRTGLGFLRFWKQ
jgi:hypothetical protein